MNKNFPINEVVKLRISNHIVVFFKRNCKLHGFLIIPTIIAPISVNERKADM